MALKQYDAEICNGIWPIVISDPAGLRQLHYIDPKTLDGRKHALRKKAWLAWISTFFADHTSFGRKRHDAVELGTKRFYHPFCYGFVDCPCFAPSI